MPSNAQWTLEFYLHVPDSTVKRRWTSHLVEIHASTDTRDQWHTEFWKHFPQGEPQLREAVASQWGISVCIQCEELESMAFCLTERLPTPPPGYYWAPETGGIMLPLTQWFRLWRRDLGFPPISE